MKNKIGFLTDLILIPSFVLTLYTGMELHMAGHDTDHHIWHNWAVFHTIVSIVFSIIATIHIKIHWGWYRGLKNKGLRNKSKITFGLSCTFIVVVTTGTVLLFCINGANSSVGFLHYITGIITSIWGILHIFKRFAILCKGLGLTFIKI